MNEAIGATLTLALGVAISPVPIIATILMLLSPTASKNGTGFLLGWLVGIAASISLFTALGTLLPTQDGDQGSRPLVAAVQAALGVGLLLLAVRQWRGRPSPDDEPQLPDWMNGLTSATPARAFGLGALLAAGNPKNLFLAIGAGVTFAEAELDSTTLVLTLTIWTLAAASTVLIPVVAALSMPQRVIGPLDSMRNWLSANNATVMCVLLLVIGVNLLGKALAHV